MSDSDVTSKGKNQPVTRYDTRDRTVTGDRIALDTIQGENILALEIQGKVIIADTGYIGGWTLDEFGLVGVDEAYIRSGQTAYNTGIGFFLGFEAGAEKFSLGDPDGNFIRWDPVDGLVTNGITATVADIGGFTVGADFIVDVGDSFGLASTVTGGDDVRFWAGDTFANRDIAPLRLYESGLLVAANASIQGEIVADTGLIGGFEIGTDYIRDVGDSFGLASTVTGGDDVRFWAGDTFANRATAPMVLYESGAAAFANVAITGGSISGDDIVAINAVNLSSRGWVQTCEFSSTGPASVAWTAGTFVSANGDSFSIIAGSISGIVARTYVYLDLNTSLTAYNYSTSAVAAVGDSKVLVAIIDPNADGAVFMLLDGTGRYIDASDIVANSITANELASSIVYAGSIQIDTGGNIRSGMTDFMVGTGFFIGTPAGTAKVAFGNPSGDYFSFDGSRVKIGGSMTVTSLLSNAVYTVATLPVSPTAVGFNNPGGDEA